MKINWEDFGFRKDYNPKKRIVKQEYVTYNNKKYYVSTIDLGLDHGFDGNPLYYETTIFSVIDDCIINYHILYCDRYETRDEAQKGHDEIIKLINENKIELINGYFEKKDISVKESENNATIY